MRTTPGEDGDWCDDLFETALATYGSAGCPQPPGVSLLSGPVRNSNLWYCSIFIQPPDAAPSCSATRPCTEPFHQCVDGACQEVCPDNPCAGHCGLISACGENLSCGGCAVGSCNTTTTMCEPDCTPGRPLDCSAGVCNPQTRRCEDECTVNSQCAQNQSCDTDQGRCVEACSPTDEPPGPSYQCVDGVWRMSCSPEDPCTDVTQSCVDGFCRTLRCSSAQACPNDRRCEEGRCLPKCYGVQCNDNFACNPSTGGCEPFDPCSGVVCEANMHCSAGGCVPDAGGGCASCLPPNQCLNDVCVFVDPCQGVYCGAGAQCIGGFCQSTGGCSSDWDCGLFQVCSGGLCIDDGGGQTCVLDGVCSAGESCACDAFCCGGGGGGGDCTYSGGGSISYGQCYACGGSVVWINDEFECADMQVN